MRKYLLYMPVGIAVPESILGEDRLYDIALNYYNLGYATRTVVDYTFTRPGDKFYTAAQVLRDDLISLRYSHYAFFDDDIETTTKDLNRMFQVGSALGLDLYQPALTPTSPHSWAHTVQKFDTIVSHPIRRVPFVEIMCPIFSMFALQKCLPLFDLTQSGWGLDVEIWPKLIPAQYVIDWIPVRHTRPIGTHTRVYPNGLTAPQELDVVKRLRYDGDT